MAATMAEGKQNMVEECNDMVRLVSSDGKIFDLKKAVASQSAYIDEMIAAMASINKVMGAENPIPVPNTSSKILEMVIEYCRYHVDHPPRPIKTADDIDEWDVKFVNNVDLSTLSDLANAAHYLNIKSLTNSVCRRISLMIQSCETADEVRQMLGIQNDLTPEEEENIRRQYERVFL